MSHATTVDKFRNILGSGARMEFSAAAPPPAARWAVSRPTANAEQLSNLFKSEDVLEKMYAVYHRALDYHRRGLTTKCSVHDIMRLGNFIATDAMFAQNDVYVEYDGAFETSSHYSFYSRDPESNLEFLRITIHL